MNTKNRFLILSGLTVLTSCGPSVSFKDVDSDPDAKSYAEQTSLRLGNGRTFYGKAIEKTIGTPNATAMGIIRAEIYDNPLTWGGACNPWEKNTVERRCINTQLDTRLESNTRAFPSPIGRMNRAWMRLLADNATLTAVMGRALNRTIPANIAPPSNADLRAYFAYFYAQEAPNDVIESLAQISQQTMQLANATGQSAHQMILLTLATSAAQMETLTRTPTP